MTDLSAEDRVAIVEATRQSAMALVRDQPTVERIYLAGKAAGRAEGLEQAARICDEAGDDRSNPQWAYGCDFCAAAIRAAAKEGSDA